MTCFTLTEIVLEEVYLTGNKVETTIFFQQNLNTNEGDAPYIVLFVEWVKVHSKQRPHLLVNTASTVASYFYSMLTIGIYGFCSYGFVSWDDSISQHHGINILGLKPNVSGKLAIISSIISGKHDWRGWCLICGALVQLLARAITGALTASSVLLNHGGLCVHYTNDSCASETMRHVFCHLQYNGIGFTLFWCRRPHARSYGFIRRRKRNRLD